MVLETHLECSSIAIGSIVSLSGLDSDEHQMGFKWATNSSLVSLIYASDDSLRAEEWVAIAQIMKLADSLTSPLGGAKISFSPNDLDMRKVSLPDAADQDTALLWS